MRIKNMIYKGGIFFFLSVKTLLCQDIEVGMYSFDFNKKVKTSNTRVYLLEKNRMYVELYEIMKIVGITNNEWIDEIYTLDKGNIYNQEKKINLGKKYILSKGKKIYFTDEIIEKNEKIYINVDFLPNILDISDLERNDDSLIVNITTSFRLPIELVNIRKHRQEEFKNRKEEENEKAFSNPKLFEPGNLRLTYDYNKTFNPSNYEYKTVYGEYMGPLLYGEFEAYYGIYPEIENYKTRLTYRDVYKNHAVVFGDTSTNLPSVLSGSIGGMRGIGFKKDESLIGEYRNNKVTIEGVAPFGKFVELYQNGQLISYEDVKAGEYSFVDIPLTFASDTFYVVIYNLDGSIEKKVLNKYYGETPEKPGEFGFNIQVGQSVYDKYNQFIGEVNYGVTENLTLKTGVYDLKHDAYYSKENPQETKAVRLGVLYTSGYSSKPYNLELNIFKEKAEENYTYKYNQIFDGYRVGIDGGKYEKSAEKRLGKKYELSLNLDKSRFIKDNISLGLKYYLADYSYGRNSEAEEVGAVIRWNFRDFTPEYGYYRDLKSGEEYHDFYIRSYYFRNYSLYAGVSHREINNYNEIKYRVDIMSRQHLENGLRYSIFYEKSNRYGDVFGLTFEIDYETWFSGRTSYSKNNGRSYVNTGFRLDKIISLSDLNTEISSIENSFVKGIVYVDLNGNGIYDEEIDKALPRTEVSVNGRNMLTDENGEYFIGNISTSFEQELRISAQNPLYKGKVDVYKLKLNPASSIELNIPVYTRKIVSGMINFSDENLRNKYLKTLYITIIEKKTKKEVEVVLPENDGFYIMENLITGEYLIQVESVENPGEILYEGELNIDANTKEINMDLNVEREENEKSDEKEKLAFRIVIVSNN